MLHSLSQRSAISVVAFALVPVALARTFPVAKNLTALRFSETDGGEEGSSNKALNAPITGLCF
jgi:hypothetical protein